MAEEQIDEDVFDTFDQGIDRDIERIKRLAASGNLSVESELVSTVLPALKDFSELMRDMMDSMDERLSVVEQESGLQSMLLPDDAELLSSVILSYKAVIEAGPKSADTQRILRVINEALTRIDEITVDDDLGDDGDGEDEE